MSRNIIHTVGQHVFKFLPPEYTEMGAPVLAKHPDIDPNNNNTNNKPKFQFLGQGYYFWDFNIERAQKWGKDHYDDNYLILEGDLVLQGESFLDLAGSREDLILFVKAFNKLAEHYPNLQVGEFFYWMQTMAKKEKVKWPYTIIRALNVKSKVRKVAFNRLRGSEMILDPEIIICFYEKNELNIHNIHYIDKNRKIWTPKKS